MTTVAGPVIIEICGQGPRHRPPCVEEEALPAFCPVPLVARKQLSNFECFAVYEWWQNPDLSLGMCRKSVFIYVFLQKNQQKAIF